MRDSFQANMLLSNVRLLYQVFVDSKSILQSDVLPKREGIHRDQRCWARCGTNQTSDHITSVFCRKNYFKT